MDLMDFDHSKNTDKILDLAGKKVSYLQFVKLAKSLNKQLIN